MDKPITHPADIADHLERMPLEEAEHALRGMSKEQAASVLAELDRQSWPAVLETMSDSDLADLIPYLPNAQTADLLNVLPVPRRREILARLPLEKRDSIRELIEYPWDTAGGIMSNQFLTLQANKTVEECQDLLRGKSQEIGPDTISYLYVTDHESKLVGIVSLRDLIFQRRDRRIEEIMNPDVKHVWVDDDQEKIAQLFEHYHYMALPVLERSGRIVGVVIANQVIDILQKEATEDMQLMVGLSGEEHTNTSWKKSFSRRLPWLCINLATAFLAGYVVGLFEETIATWTALAIFLPIVAGQGGNAATQTLTVIIRDMALGQLSKGDGRRALAKELLLGLLNGIVIGLIVGAISLLWKGNIKLGIVVSIAMLLNLLAAALSGVLVPYGLRALRIDPALASSILVTTVTDVAGFLFFLGLASLMLS